MKRYTKKDILKMRKSSGVSYKQRFGKPKHKSNKSLIKQLDNLWSEAVKKRAKFRCEKCGKTTTLNSHHIFSRSNKRVRFDIDNGVCVCVAHHIFGLFSAHKSPIEFVEWLKKVRGKEWYERIRNKANITLDYKKLTNDDIDKIKEQLKLTIDKK
jgi:hypothetical protein